MFSVYSRIREFSAILITLLLMLLSGQYLVHDASTPLLPSSEVAYSHGYCDTAVTTSSSQVVEASDVETEMSNDGIDQSLTPTIGAGTYVYRMVLTGGGGDLTISELEVCFDGAVPTDSVVKGNSDAGDIWRTQIDATYSSNYNTTNSSMFQFNNQGWVVDAESPTSTSVYVILNSKWGTNMDTVITWWLFMGSQIDVRFDHPGTENFQSMVVDAYRIEGVVGDSDSDNDGVLDRDDVCPGFDDNIDSDGDGIPDGCDNFQDSDEDGWSDDNENECLSNPNDSSSVPLDFDDDDICDQLDPDDDNDGVLDINDDCPRGNLNWISSTTWDIDSDGCRDSIEDDDDDNDGVNDNVDEFPLDASESVDSDGDGVGNNADPCPTSPSGEILSSVEGCTLIEVYMPTLYLDDRECYLPINRHWDDFDVSNNFENYQDSRVDEDCSSYSSSSSPTPTVYYEVVEYSDHYVFEYWFYYADSRFEALRPYGIPSLAIHEHDFEWAFVWVDKSDLEPYYFALSQHYWENEHFISSTDDLWAHVEWGGHGMVHHSESSPPWYAQGDGLVFRPGDFEFIQMNPTAADIGMGEFLRGNPSCTNSPVQCKAPWLQPQYTYPEYHIYDSGPKGMSFYNDMVAGMTIGQLFSPAELYAQDDEGRITGLIDGEIREEIPLSWYDAEREMVIIFGNGSNYEFFVDGKANATYGLSLSSGNASNITFFNATDIPTNVGELHHYSVNWSALGENGTSVNITVDFENDGIIDYEFWSDATLNQSEFTTAITLDLPESPIECPDGFELSLEEECVTTDSTSVVNVGSGSISLTSVLAMSILAILAGVICVMFIIRRRKGLESKG